jgi:ATP-dependent metalloprotease
MARALAGESECYFEYINSSSVEGAFVGSGVRQIKNLFQKTKSRDRPTIIFFDEFDSIAQKRNAISGQFASQTLNQLLTEMDGFESNSKVFVLAATNYPQALDPAVTRPGRFDKTVQIPQPAKSARVEIIKYYLGKIKHTDQVDADFLARSTNGMTGADIKNLVNVAAINAVKMGRKAADREDFDFAIDRLSMGILNKSIQTTTNTLYHTAIHEAGHAMVSLLNGESVPMSKVTILSKGGSLG